MAVVVAVKMLTEQERLLKRIADALGWIMFFLFIIVLNTCHMNRDVRTISSHLTK